VWNKVVREIVGEDDRVVRLDLEDTAGGPVSQLAVK
jgi:hypothetical protein